jgi:hypothetical protein
MVLYRHAVLSAEADTRREPVALKQTSRISSSWPSSVDMHLPVTYDNIRCDLSLWDLEENRRQERAREGKRGQERAREGKRG